MDEGQGTWERVIGKVLCLAGSWGPSGCRSAAPLCHSYVTSNHQNSIFPLFRLFVITFFSFFFFAFGYSGRWMQGGYKEKKTKHKRKLLFCSRLGNPTSRRNKFPPASSRRLIIRLWCSASGLNAHQRLWKEGGRGEKPGGSSVRETSAQSTALHNQAGEYQQHTSAFLWQQGGEVANGASGGPPALGLGNRPHFCLWTAGESSLEYKKKKKTSPLFCLRL